MIIIYSDSELVLSIRAKGHPVACLSATMTIRKLTQANNVHKNGSVAPLLVADIGVYMQMFDTQ